MEKAKMKEKMIYSESIKLIIDILVHFLHYLKLRLYIRDKTF